MRTEANSGVSPALGGGVRSARGFFSDARLVAAAIALAVLSLWAAAPAGLFTVDEYFYVQAANAMAEDGALDFAPFDVAGAPALEMGFAAPNEDGTRLVPQYPSGYAVIAAPFFAAFGVKGLTLLNALSALATLWLTLRVARRLGADQSVAGGAVLILGGATYWSTYAFAIWPHMLALALVLAVVERALAAADCDARAAIVAGLLTGVGQTIRVDFIVLVPAVILFLRFFCDGRNRFLSIAFIVGAAPGFLGAAFLNLVKFGVFNPFTYENDHAANDPAAFILLGVAVAMALAAVFVVDLRRFARAPRSKLEWSLAGGVALALLAAPPVLALLKGYWVSLVDVQAYEFLDRQQGIDRTPWGLLSFYGVDKKAFLQSIPFAALAIPALARLLRGKAAPGEGLLWLVAGGFATLYSWNQTDSGLGYNARFLTPLLPIVAIFAAIELKSLLGAAPALRLAAAGLLTASAFLALRSGLEGPGPMATPAALYPQLGVAGLLAAFLIVRLLRPTRSTEAMSAMLAVAAVGAAVAISADDFIRDRSYRAYAQEQAGAYGAAVSEGSLVFTADIMFFAAAASEGLGVAYPGRADPSAARRAVAAFGDAGRCVYAQGERAISWAREQGLTIASSFSTPALRNGPIALIGPDHGQCRLGSLEFSSLSAGNRRPDGARVAVDFAAERTEQARQYSLAERRAGRD